MESAIRKKLYLSTAIGAAAFVITGMFLPKDSALGWYSGYGIGLLAVFLHYGATVLSNKSLLRDFLVSYYFGLFLRFAIVISLFILIIILTKIDELSFTVSFIISYILHSVNEMIFLNQKLSD